MTLRFGIISHLKACKNIKVTFNPWLPQTRSIREVFHLLYSPKLRNTNDKCKIQFDIRSDAVEPHLEVIYNDDSKALFKTKDLTFTDINRVFQRLSNLKYIEKEGKKE